MTYKKNESDSVFDDNNTLDIRLEGDVASLIRQKKWTAQEIETQVAAFLYSGENLPKDPEVEKARLPPFALSFYKFIFFKGRLPQETELWNYYLNQHFAAIDETHLRLEKNGKTYVIASVKARLLRSYPSLIRDFHFYVLCQTSDQFEHVSYSLRQDYYAGIDLCVQYAGHEFQVSVMLNSPRARAYKTKKYARRAEVPQNEVIMLFELYQYVQIRGQIKLFTMRHIELLVEELKKRIG